MSENGNNKVQGNTQKTSPPGQPPTSEYVRKDRAQNSDESRRNGEDKSRGNK